eukprot:2101275-Prymnesium_polylepis.2
MAYAPTLEASTGSVGLALGGTRAHPGFSFTQKPYSVKRVQTRHGTYAPRSLDVLHSALR